jgi:hypothetical protein
MFSRGGCILRFVLAIVGVLVSVPLLVFFWIGTQTFVRQLERLLAFLVTIETGALLVLSIALLFTPSVQRLQAAFLIASIATVAAILIAYRLFR